MTNFRNLKIWQKGVEIVIQVYHLSGKLPDVEKFGLRSQLTRAEVSIPSNIAEGSSRTSEKDFARFLEISLGSTFELETQLLIIQELKLIETEVLGNLLENLNEEQKMIMGYIKKLNT